MTKRVISTEGAPRAVGPYSQAVAANGFVFLSGQIPLDPATGQLIESTDVGDHVRRVMDNLEAVLAAAGSGLQHAVKADDLSRRHRGLSGSEPRLRRVFRRGAARARHGAGRRAATRARVEIDLIATC